VKFYAKRKGGDNMLVEIYYKNGKFETVSKALFQSILKYKRSEIYYYRYIRCK